MHARSLRAEEKKFRILPQSCSEAAQYLAKDRKLYEVDGVFPERLIETVIHRLDDYKDRNLLREMLEKPEELQKAITQYLHYG